MRIDAAGDDELTRGIDAARRADRREAARPADGDDATLGDAEIGRRRAPSAAPRCRR